MRIANSDYYLPSMKAVNSQLGIPMALLKTAKQDGGEGAGFGSASRVDCVKLVRWLFSRDTEENTDWGGRLTRAKALYEEERLAKAKAELVRKAEVQDIVVGGCLAFVGNIEKKLVNTLPPILEGLTAIEISHRCKTELAEICIQYRERLALEITKLGEGELPPVEDAEEKPTRSRRKRIDIVKIQRKSNARQKPA